MAFQLFRNLFGRRKDSASPAGEASALGQVASVESKAQVSPVGPNESAGGVATLEAPVADLDHANDPLARRRSRFPDPDSRFSLDVNAAPSPSPAADTLLGEIREAELPAEALGGTEAVFDHAAQALRELGKQVNVAQDRKAQETTSIVVRRKSSKESALDKIERGYNEVLDMVRTVRDHMEQQGQRQERLLQVLSGLPEALNTLPEATRNQTQALQALHEVLRKQGEKEGKLAEALQSVAHAQEKQDRSLGIVHTQLNVQGQTTSNMVEGLKSINSSLGHLSDRNEATARSLSNLADQTRKQDDTVRALFERNQRQITVMSVVSWTLAIVALTIAAAVAVSLGRLASGAPTSSVPTANASNVSQP